MFDFWESKRKGKKDASKCLLKFHFKKPSEMLSFKAIPGFA